MESWQLLTLLEGAALGADLIAHILAWQAYVRNVFPDSNAYRLTVDPEITPEKAEAEQKERDEQRAALKDRKVD